MGIRRPGETAAAALRRLERSSAYARIIKSDEGQQLLAEAARESQTARRGGR